MPLGFELTIFIYAVAWALFWIVRPASVQWALRFLAVFNLLVIFCASALLFMYLVTQIMLICMIYQLRGLFPVSWRGHLPWFAFIGLIPFNIQAYYGSQLDLAAYLYPWSDIGLPNVFWYLGASFFVIKSFVVLKEAFRESRFDFLAILNSLTFFPAFPAGPICGSHPFSTMHISRELERREVITSLAQLGWGGAAFYVIAPKLRKLAERLPDDLLGNVGEIYLGLGALYFDFSGYSLMAIAAAAMFGIKLPANFNRPYLATSIREFWQRWHMSLNWFVGTYLQAFCPEYRLAKSWHLPGICTGWALAQVFNWLSALGGRAWCRPKSGDASASIVAVGRRVLACESHELCRMVPDHIVGGIVIMVGQCIAQGLME